jgi:serine/threonine protein kinase
MHNGSLYDLMKREDYRITWKRVIKFAQQIVKGLNCLHRWIPCIVHRDVKSKNLLVDDRNSIKLSDLGLARFTTFDNQDTLFRAKGSLAYMVTYSIHYLLTFAGTGSMDKQR